MMNLYRALRHPKAYVWLALRPWRRHSMVLVFAGVVYLMFGLSCLLTSVSEIPPEQAEIYQLVLNAAPLTVWGGAWITVGFLAILSSRWPPASETWGYSALAGISALWGSLVCASVLFGAPSQALSSGLVFYLLAFIWWAISGLVNPAEKVRGEPGHE